MTIYSILNKLENLSHDTKPIWGIMSSQHMVEHLIDSFRLSNGKLLNKKCMTPENKLSLLKRILMSNRPFPRNFVNNVIGGDLKPLNYNNLEVAKEILKREVEDMNKFFELNPNEKPINPTFGPLNKEEWNHFHKKHLTHHFTQFGLLDE